SSRSKAPQQPLWKPRSRAQEAAADAKLKQQQQQEAQQQQQQGQQQQQQDDASAAVQATAAVYKAKAQTKVAVRHLHPTVTEEQLLQQVPPELKEALISSWLIPGRTLQ
ncbi:hypothetical protein, conserved, partial [Eimeria tenella]